MTHCYKSRGNHNILNRANILRICQHVPGLTHLVTRDIESVSFITSNTAPGGEAGLVGLTSEAFTNNFLDHKEVFMNWGIIVEKQEPA